MGVYSNFSTSDYYDKKPQQQVQQQSTVKQTYNQPAIPEHTRKSLYDQAKTIAESTDKYKGPDFRKVYRVGQMVAIQGANGQVRTGKGMIAEVVAENLMYVYMTDAYRDANDQWLVDFVTDKDIVTPL